MDVDPRRENSDVTMRREIPFSGQTEPSPNSNPDPDSIAAEIWAEAEESTREIVCRIHPTIEDDQKRKQVIEYVQGLIKRSLDYQVLPYGSVPLKTYLPDGDIDLTAIGNPGFEDALVSEVHTVLSAEELNQNASYEVKDIRFIDAEVKLVKCFVHNIVVDISFNQLGGLSTLCFLEKVDRLVGKNHLFKRSIILIKAWCYYESRILGAHHGLISTYALETLILYIFHLFHHSLSGPLSVLYRFLDYFSKFDWDNFVVSLNGPVCKSSLPRNYAEPHESKGELLFTDEFLKECMQMFTVPSRNLELNSRAFTQKHLNIIDPLKENNNLGRSVNRANFYRVRSAFKYGARKLGQILVLPKERIADELNNFFANTLFGHGSNDMNGFQNLFLGYGSRISENESSLLQSNISSLEGNRHSRLAYQTNRNRPSCSGRSPSDLYFSQVAEENGALESMVTSGEMMAKLTTDDKMKCWPLRDPKDHSSRIGNPVSSFTDGEFGSPSVAETSPLNDEVSSKLHCRAGARETAVVFGNSQPSRSLLDLTGDYDSHFGSLVYVQYCHLYPVCASVLPSPLIFPQSLNKNPLEPVSQSLQLHHNGYPLINVNGVFLPQLYYMNHPPTFNTSFGSEERKDRRGTGTYIPNMSPHSNRDRWFPSRRDKVHPQGSHGSSQRHTQDNMNSGQLQRHKHDHDKGVLRTPRGTKLSDHIHDLSEAEYPYLGNDKPTSPQRSQSHLVMQGTTKINGFSHPSEKIGSKSQSFKLHERPLPERLNSCSGTSDSPSSPELAMAWSPE